MYNEYRIKGDRNLR